MVNFVEKDIYTKDCVQRGGQDEIIAVAYKHRTLPPAMILWVS